MPKPPGIPFDQHALRALISKRNSNPSDLAKKLGVTRQLINQWFKSGRIAPRRLSEVGMIYDITHEEMQKLLPNDSKPKLQEEINKLRDQMTRIWEILNEP